MVECIHDLQMVEVQWTKTNRSGSKYDTNHSSKNEEKDNKHGDKNEKKTTATRTNANPFPYFEL
jgi:hypothetical protein